MAWEVESRVSRSRAAVKRKEDRENAGDKKAPPGRYYIPIPKPVRGDKLPSFADWIDEQERKKGRK